MVKVSWFNGKATQTGMVVGFVPVSVARPDGQEAGRTLAIVSSGGKLVQVYIDALTVIK